MSSKNARRRNAQRAAKTIPGQEGKHRNKYAEFSQVPRNERGNTGAQRSSRDRGQQASKKKRKEE